MATRKEIKALITLAGKVDPSLQSALLKAAGNTNKLKDTMKKTGSIAGGVFKGVISAKIITKAAGALKNAAQQALQLASDLEEVQNVVDVTFGKNADQINKWSKTALKAYGLSELEAKKYTGTMGAMLKSSGLADENVMKLSTDLVGLAGDMASFYNLDPEEAFQKIRSGISGQTEPLKQLGINMSIANLEAFALSKGLKTAYKDMDQGSQAMLRYAYLMEVTKDAQGDFARTQDSYANQQKLLRENFKQLSSQLLNKVLPVAAKGLALANKFLSRIDGSKAGEKLSNVLSIVIEKAQPVVRLFQAIYPLIEKIIPIVGNLAYIIGTVLSKAIELVTPIVEKLIGFLQPLVGGIGTVVSKVKDFFSGGGSAEPGKGMKKFSRGGLATSPSIFGENGPEMAIPIRPGDPRSIGLLSKTAQMLGVSSGPQISISMPIHINAPGGDPAAIKRAAAQAGDEMEERIIAIMERYYAGKARVSYG